MTWRHPLEKNNSMVEAMIAEGEAGYNTTRQDSIPTKEEKGARKKKSTREQRTEKRREGISIRRKSVREAIRTKQSISCL
jgi:hypothetical protein